MSLSRHTTFDPVLFLVACTVGLSGLNVSTDVAQGAELQQQSESLSRRHEGAADVFGVILPCAVARLSCLAEKPDVSEGRESS